MFNGCGEGRQMAFNMFNYNDTLNSDFEKIKEKMKVTMVIMLMTFISM